jgi:hypothetical protein
LHPNRVFAIIDLCYAADGQPKTQAVWRTLFSWFQCGQRLQPLLTFPFGGDFMDRHSWRKVDAAINKALAAVGEKFEVKLNTRGFRFTDTDCMFKLEAVVKKVDGHSFNKAKSEFKQYAYMFGLKASHYGKTFESRGKTLKVVGLKLRGRRYPVICEDVSTGNRYKLPEADVLNHLKAA